MNPLFLAAGGLSLLLLFGLSAFFSGCETVLFSLSPIQIQRIRQRDAAAGGRLERLLADPALTLSTLLVGNTLVNFALATLGFWIADTCVPGRGEMIAIPLMTLALLLFGEVTPKRVAIGHAERLAAPCSRLLLFWLRLLRPFSAILTAGPRVFGQALGRERRALTDDELRTVMEVGEEQGVLEAGEASMVDGVMRLSELKASDAMTPRVDMVGLDLDTPLERQLAVARQSRFRYLPAYVRNPDAIEGFLDVVAFLLDPAHDVSKATVSALFVPENVSLDELLITFQRNAAHIACVLDEYGGTAGLITRGDILELITAAAATPGQADERSEIRPMAGGGWLIDGTASLEEINRRLSLSLEADDADRLAGWITFHAGRLLELGGSVEAQGCRATVRRMRKRRITVVQFDIVRREEEEEEESDREGDEIPQVVPDEEDGLQ